MAQAYSTGADGDHGQEGLLQRLLELYEQEQRIYGRVLDLSQEQGEIIRSDGAFEKLKGVLTRKRECLDAISSLEQSRSRDRTAWLASRDDWSGPRKAALQRSLQRVTSLIEEILRCEEENDRILLEKTRSF
jgi:flagellar biosynthesis/type III secretory pathway chaperone